MAETPSRRNPLRTAGALFAGFAVIVVLSTATDLALHTAHVFPEMGQPMTTALWVLALAYRCAYGVFGCWLAARLAPTRPMAHALALGAVGVVLSALGTIATWDKGPGFGPRWYPLSLVVTALPCAWIGGRMVRGPVETQPGA